MTQGAGGANQDLLLKEYDLCRGDDRQGLTVTVTLLSLDVAVAAGMIALVNYSNSCRVANKVCAPVRNMVWASLPLAPLAIGALIIQIGFSTLLRRYYMKAIERTLMVGGATFISLGGIVRQGQIMELIPEAGKSSTDPSPHEIPIPSWIHLLQLITSPVRAEWLLRVLNYTLYIAVLLATGLLSYLSLRQITTSTFRWGASLFYLAAGLIIVTALYGATAGRRTLWNNSRKQLGERLRSPLYGESQ